MPRKRRQILPFRIPFFRIFYSTTYTITFLITLFFLAITPGSLLWEAIQNNALQYVFIIAGVYIVTAVIAIFIYSSRLYTNRSVLAGVGKAYIPIEDGEIGKGTRKMIVSQLERSAVISWEAKPRDIKGEVVFAEKEGLIAGQNINQNGQIDTIGMLVTVDIDDPPWGNVQHPGWTAPSDAPSELQSDLQFEVVIAELANLLEARAVSLAPVIPRSDVQDPRYVEILRRQEGMGMREYLTQLSYLRLIDLDTHGREFLRKYERARFSGTPTTYNDFKALMSSFGMVLDSMKQLDPRIAGEIQAQVTSDHTQGQDGSQDVRWSALHSYANSLEDNSPVTARTRFTTPYLSQGNASFESFGSILRSEEHHRRSESAGSSLHNSYAGSMIHYHG